MNTEKVIKRDQKYIMHTYARSPLVLEHGEGMYAYDADGKAYLDFTSAAFFQPVLHRPLRQAGQAAVRPHRA